MDHHLPRNNEGFANNNNLFGDSQQYNAYDNLFQTGTDQTSYDASWGLNASAQNYPQAASRAQHHAPAPSWPQNANHLSTSSTHANVNGEAAPYVRSLSHSPAPFGQNAFGGYGTHHTYQYQQPQYDPTLVPPHAFNQNFDYSATNYQQPNAGTIAPHALQNDARSPGLPRSPYEGSTYGTHSVGLPRPNKSSASEYVDQFALASAIPNGQASGYFSIINFNDLGIATNSERMGNFLNIGRDAGNWDVNRAALPSFVPRRSRKALRKAAVNDPKLLAKLGKKSLKKERRLLAATKPIQTPAALTATSGEKIKYEGESSSEEESSSADDEGSSYTSDDDSETSPLPAKRPATPKEGTEYDTIKALWRGKRKNLGSESIKKGLGDFWEIVKTIRDRWKADQTALTEAETKKRTNELPLLESRVKDQRDMMEAAFKAALKHGNRGIVELFAENDSLIFLCYQFLLNRFKAEDFNGSLPRVMLETMTYFTTITNERLEKTHLIKVLPRFVKTGDAKTQFYAKRILANAAARSKEKSAPEPAKSTATKESKVASPTSKRAEPEPVAGVKRAASTAGDGAAQKKVAVSASKANATSGPIKQNGVARKAVAPPETAKTLASAPTVSKPKQVVAKPSGLFSSLQSAAKKPGTSTLVKTAQASAAGTASKPAEKYAATPAAAGQNVAPKSTFSFAETMANLSKPKEEKPAPKQEKQAPPETSEQKTKRLRKESRRGLNVSFKPGDELEEVRVFHHDPGEELGHDDSQTRDLADVGGEGRMFKKQHHMMDVDEDDEAAEEDEKLVEFGAPNPIDFNDVDLDERKRNYAPFGGGRLQPESAERAQREHYDANTLIVVYTDPSDIPPNPREPSEPYSGDKVESAKKFGAPEAKWAIRSRQRKAASPSNRQSVPQPVMQNHAAPNFDLSKFTGYLSGQQTLPNNQFQPPTQAPAPSNEALSNILASLKHAAPSQNTPPPPVMGAYGASFATPQNAYQSQQPAAPPAGQPDLAAILAQITGNQPAAGPPPQMGGYGFGAPGAGPTIEGYPQVQQPDSFENPDRKRFREGVTGENNMSRSTRQNPAQNPWFRTKICKYWQEGRCQKGDGCTYKHAEED